MRRNLALALLSLPLSLGAPVPAAAKDDPPPEPPRGADLLRELEGAGRGAVEPPPAAAGPPVVLRGGTVMTAGGETFSPGHVVMAEGRVTAVGPGEPGAIPEGAVMLDVTGKHVTPGLIDTHSHLGVYPAPDARAHSDGNEATAPTTPGVWAEHSFWPEDPQIDLALAGGVTTLQALPGSANLVGGRGAVVHLVPARGSRAMLLPGAPGTLKMACGENPKRVYGTRQQAPSTRMGNLRTLRQALLSAKKYEETWDAWSRKKAKHERDEAGKRPKKGKGGEGGPEPFAEPAPERDLDKEALAALLRGDLLAQVHCYRADDMLAFLQVAEELGFRVRSFHHALEAYKIRDVLAARGVAVSTWADWWGFKLEARDGIPENLALVTEAGGRAIVHSDSPVGIQRLNQEAAKGFAAGRQAGIRLTEDDALRWITANPAWALGIDHLVGSLRPGLRADVVVWDGSPFSVYTRAEKVFVDGVLRHDSGNPGIGSDALRGLEVEP